MLSGWIMSAQRGRRTSHAALAEGVYDVADILGTGPGKNGERRESLASQELRLPDTGQHIAGVAHRRSQMFHLPVRCLCGATAVSVSGAGCPSQVPGDCRMK